MYNLSFTTGIPVQYVIMLDWIQLSSSLDSSLSKSIIIGGISLLSMQFSFPYSFSIFNTWSSAFAQTSFVIVHNVFTYKILFISNNCVLYV
jgi:hypothetical protein